MKTPVFCPLRRQGLTPEHIKLIHIYKYFHLSLPAHKHETTTTKQCWSAQIKLLPSEDTQLLVCYTVSLSAQFMMFQRHYDIWNMGTICPETQHNIRIWTKSLVTSPWKTQILHNSRLHAISHMNIQWSSQINTNQLIPWGRVLSEKLIIPQLIKKFPTFYGTPRFVTTFTSTCHLSLSWSWQIQSMPDHLTSWKSILIFYSHLYLGFLNSPFHSGLSTNILHAPLLSPIHATCPTHLILLYKTQHNLKNFLSHLNLSFSMLQPVAW